MEGEGIFSFRPWIELHRHNGSKQGGVTGSVRGRKRLARGGKEENIEHPSGVGAPLLVRLGENKVGFQNITIKIKQTSTPRSYQF